VNDDFEALNFFQDEVLVADPYPYFSALREKSPVLRERHQDVVLVTGYEEAVSVFSDPKTWSSCISVTGPFPGFPVPLEGAGDDITELIEKYRHEIPLSDQLPMFDPPTHTAHRGLLMRLITPKRLKESEDEIEGLASGLLDRFLTGGEGEFISQFAGPFSLIVIADLLGVPEADRPEFVAAMQRRPQADAGIGSTGHDEVAHSPMEYLYDRFSTYIEDRRREPGTDVLSGLASATFPDGSIPEVMDVVRVAANVFSAGQETTVRLLSSALMIIAERPDIQQLLRAEPERISNFIEETLRAESPIKGDFRLARVPATVGGVDLPAGTMVMVLNGAANRDPRRFEDPDTFDLARQNARQHIAFGRGIHTCPGAPLARAEARACIKLILQRTSDIRISERVHGPADNRRYQYLPTYILRGLTHLGLEFTLAGEAG
jgi:cytochrome P450